MTREKESSAHIKLKEIAKEFLSGCGCTEILEEYKIGRARVDVLGKQNGVCIAIECGGTSYDKLPRLSRLVNKIYILPYGETRPYLWTPKIKPCNSCGHNIGKDGEEAEKLLTLDEAASILRLHRETVKWYISQGKITAIKLGYRTIRIKKSVLDEFIKAHTEVKQ